MEKRAVVIGAVLAFAISTAVVFLILSDCGISVKSHSCSGDWVTPGMGHVLVATRDIEPGESVNALIETGGIAEYMVPLETLVPGAAKDVSQIERRTATRSIEENEQISLDNLSKRGPR